MMYIYGREINIVLEINTLEKKVKKAQTGLDEAYVSIL